MPADLSISPITALPGLSPQSPNPTLGPTTPAASEAATTPAAGSVSCTPIYPNPDMHIDAASNLVVIAFRNAAGDVVDQIPTQQQLNAYRQGQAISTD